jgi:hypothetical protein
MYAGQTIEHVNITGTLTISNPDVTVSDVCVTGPGDGVALGGSIAVQILAPARNTVIRHTTITAPNRTTAGLDLGIKNWSGQPATLSFDDLSDCGVCIDGGPWTVEDSYVISDAVLTPGASGPEHTEAVYYDNDVPAPYLTFNHDTMLNPHGETAVIFGDNSVGGACKVHLTVKHSLLAGGGYTIYTCGGSKSTSAGTSAIDVEGNRFARCRTSPVTFNVSTGGYACRGSTAYRVGSGADERGYWPRGGYYGPNDVAYCPPLRGQTWTGNVWDDDGRPVRC